MNVKKLLIGCIIASMSIMPMASIYANEGTPLMNKARITLSVVNKSDAEIEKEYNNKVIEAYKKYLNITLPSKAKFSVSIMDEAHLNKEEAKWTEQLKNEYKNKKMTEQKYKQQLEKIKKEYDGLRAKIKKLDYTYVECQYITTYEKLNSLYLIKFDKNTGEVISILAPMSDKGWAIQTSKTKPTISKEVDEKIDAVVNEYMRKHHIGGIQKPKIIDKSATRNMIYVQEASDVTKLAMIEMDCTTHTVIGFETKGVKEMLQ